MKAVIQVVGQASLSVDGKLISQIGKGLVVFFCVEKGDEEQKLDFFAKKISSLRIFSDENGKTNLSARDVGGEILLVPQFTLVGDCVHGNRPNFFAAEEPKRAKEMFLRLAEKISKNFLLPVKLGVFGADMTILQENRGPFTVLL